MRCEYGGATTHSASKDFNERRVYLIQYLDRCNNRLGPGFKLFGVVVLDIHMMEILATVVSTLLAKFIDMYDIFDHL